MTWQEELRRLDEELAAGSLTADEYRTRRDRVLSMAVTNADGPQQAPGQPPSNATETQIIAPVSLPGQQHDPNQQAASAEATQIVSAADTGGERTQVVQPWQQQHPNSPSGGFPQPMPQYQQPYSQQSPAGGFPAPQQQPPQQQNPWGQPQQDASPPWGGSDFPPVGPSSNAEWISQGPETFQTRPSSGKGKKIAFGALGLVVLAGLGFGVWALFIKNGDTPVAQPSTSQQPPPVPTTKPLPEPPAAKAEPSDNASALVTPAGQTRAGGGTFDVAKLESAKFLPNTVVERLKSGGMTEGLLKTSTDGDVTLGLYALEMPNADATKPVAQEYANAQQEGGLTAARDLSMHGVQVFATPDGGQQAVYRAVYVLYSRVIIVDAYGPDKAATLDSFKTLLTAQVQKSPPTERSNS